MVAFVTLLLDYTFHATITSPMEVPAYFAMKLISSFVIALLVLRITRIHPFWRLLLGSTIFALWVDAYYGLFVLAYHIPGLTSSPNQVITILTITDPILLLFLWTIAHGFFFFIGGVVAFQ